MADNSINKKNSKNSGNEQNELLVGNKARIQASERDQEKKDNSQPNDDHQGRKKANKAFIYFIAALAAFNGLLFGFDTGVISGALLFIKQEFNLNSTMQEVVTSAVLVGAVIGAAFAGFLTDKLGRRITIIGTAIVFVAGALSTSLAPFLWWLIISRVVVGLGIGVASFIGPLYISELAPPQTRGSMVTYNQLAVTVGIFVAYLVDLAFSPTGAWRWMFAIHLIPAAILGIGMFFVPDSPRFLVLKDKEEEARDVLYRIRPKGGVEEELSDIKEKTEGDQKNGWKELFRPVWRVALVVGIGLAILQQVTGINTVIYYAPTIFKDAGINSNTSSILATTIVGVVNVLFTILAVVLMDRVGRRPLLLIGVAGMVIGLAGLGVVFMFNTQGTMAWFAIGCTLFYTASFAIGLGPVFWLLISEIYPTRVRGRATSLATVANWAANLVVAITFLTLFDLLGKPGTFWLYAVIGVGTWVFSYFLVPETKGKSLEEIEEYWNEKSDSKEGQKANNPPRHIHGSGPMLE